MNIKNGIICGLLWLLVILLLACSHYKTAAKSTALELVQIQNEYQQNIVMLQRYRQQIAALNNQLTIVHNQAEKRKKQINEVLNDEKNKSWANQPVPDDISRVFSAGADTNAINLSADSNMPIRAGKH